MPFVIVTTGSDSFFPRAGSASSQPYDLRMDTATMSPIAAALMPQ